MGIRISFVAAVAVAALAGCAQPARAQSDFAGEWQPVRNQDNSENPSIGDFVGLPLNEAGLARAEAWDAAIQSMPEWQCRPHGWAYIYRGPTALRIWKDIDPFTREVTAFHAQWQQSAETPIYLDRRPHPPDYAPYTWMGFSTAVWEGTILRITTTHIKEDYYRRNGIFASDRATVTTYWSRHGDYLTWINIVHDPVYLTEPLIRSGEYRLNLGAAFPPHPCTPTFEGHETSEVPSHLPGTNPFLNEPAAMMKIPPEALRAGARTMYPEFRQTLKQP